MVYNDYVFRVVAWNMVINCWMFSYGIRHMILGGVILCEWGGSDEGVEVQFDAYRVVI